MCSRFCQTNAMSFQVAVRTLEFPFNRICNPIVLNMRIFNPITNYFSDLQTLIPMTGRQDIRRDGGVIVLFLRHSHQILRHPPVWKCHINRRTNIYTQ